MINNRIKNKVKCGITDSYIPCGRKLYFFKLLEDNVTIEVTVRKPKKGVVGYIIADYYKLKI
jgi:hypothetical protein